MSESIKLAYGSDSPVVASNQVAAVQSLSGTGSCRLFAEFQKRFLPNSSVYIPVVSSSCGGVGCALYSTQTLQRTAQHLYMWQQHQLVLCVR